MTKVMVILVVTGAIGVVYKRFENHREEYWSWCQARGNPEDIASKPLDSL